MHIILGKGITWILKYSVTLDLQMQKNKQNFHLKWVGRFKMSSLCFIFRVFQMWLFLYMVMAKWRIDPSDLFLFKSCLGGSLDFVSSLRPAPHRPPPPAMWFQLPPRSNDMDIPFCLVCTLQSGLIKSIQKMYYCTKNQSLHLKGLN